MVEGAAIGGLSAYGAAGITSISSIMPNLRRTIAGFFYSSIGMAVLSGGRVSPNINFGLASVDLGSGEWNYLGKKEINGMKTFRMEWLHLVIFQIFGLYIKVLIIQRVM